MLNIAKDRCKQIRSENTHDVEDIKVKYVVANAMEMIEKQIEEGKSKEGVIHYFIDQGMENKVAKKLIEKAWISRKNNVAFFARNYWSSRLNGNMYEQNSSRNGLLADRLGRIW